jgi:hypothetical protein
MDLGRTAGQPISFDEFLVSRHWLPIDTNQVILRFAMRDPLLKQLIHGSTWGHFDIVGEAAAIIIDEQYTHCLLLKVE